jgi:hypothetical protein
MKNSLPADRCYRSQAIPGLEIEVLEPSDWTEGRKVRVYYRGEELREGEVEEQARKAAERLARQAQHAREAAERLGQLERQARMSVEQQAEQERQARMSAEQQVEQLLARLRQAGLEP